MKVSSTILARFRQLPHRSLNRSGGTSYSSQCFNSTKLSNLDVASLEPSVSATDTSSVAGAVAAAAVLGTYCTTQLYSQCEESSPPVAKQSSSIWPPGVNHVDIEELVDEIMNDPTVNLTLIPDVLERRIYKSTIQLTLNSFYMVLGSVDGVPLLSHQIKVKRTTKEEAAKQRTKNYLIDQTKNVDVEVLGEIADRLLANPVINARMLPDAIEKQIYVNCMVIIFRILAVIVHSFRITICGHDIGLRLEPHQFEASAVNAVVVQSSLSKLDIDQIKAFAETCGVPPEGDENIAEGLSDWDNILNRRSFLVKLHTCMYSLILGIVDDLLANTKIRVLSDIISLDVVPAENNLATRPSKIDAPKTVPTDQVEGGPPERPKFSSLLPMISFAAGIGVGAATVPGAKRFGK